ncbi:hypothetical protein ABW19_dt0202727 [Dactylella cylindrospora]|nr:hypothetical protein ABW19_dt0202727 [Dactylella cylindrospora]
MSNTLEPGLYIIRSKAFPNFIGRRNQEDMSLLPKKIMTLPEGVEAPRWEVQRHEGGPEPHYTLKAGGSHTATIDDKLWAILLPEPIAERWIITAQPQHGENTYTVEKENREGGWVIPNDEPYVQVDVRPLIVAPSLPPHFPPTELFEFVRIDRD